MCRKLVCLPILCLLILAGCASHSPSIQKPSGDADAAAWLSYYKYQFKAHGNEVPRPGNNTSQAQQMAYMEAESSWKNKQTRDMLFGVVILGIGAASLLVTLSSM